MCEAVNGVGTFKELGFNLKSKVCRVVTVEKDDVGEKDTLMEELIQSRDVV